MLVLLIPLVMQGKQPHMECGLPHVQADKHYCTKGDSGSVGLQWPIKNIAGLHACCVILLQSCLAFAAGGGGGGGGGDTYTFGIWSLYQLQRASRPSLGSH